MIRLTLFETGKIIKKKSFWIGLIILAVINIFFLWDVNLPKEMEPKLSAYKAFQRDISGMSEGEKSKYVKDMYEKMEGIDFVNEITNLKSMGGMEKNIGESKLKENPDLFQKYSKMYKENNYLKYTDTLDAEDKFVKEMHREMNAVNSYHQYLEKVKNNKSDLNEISIFAENKRNDFSNKNIDKSALDYKKMDGVKTKFYPSKGVKGAMENNITDLILIMAVFLVAGGLIYEEKEKKLFYITRATAGGRGKSIGAKIFTSLICSIIIAVLLVGENIIFYGLTVGFGDVTRSIQSVYGYMESCLKINVWQYMVLSVVTKAMVMFAISTILIFVAVITKHVFAMYLAGGLVALVAALAYGLIPAYSTWSWAKYLNFVGILKTQNLYGAYLNLNIAGEPVSRTRLSLIVLLVYIIIGTLAAVIFFLKCNNMECVKTGITLHKRKKVPENLMGHECYKIMIVNSGLIVFIIFSMLIGYKIFSKQYNVSPMEEYYKSIMCKLDGDITQEKEELIKTEKARYDKIFAQIKKVDEMENTGQIDSEKANILRDNLYSEVSFYQAFKRVLKQYDNVKSKKGKFVYDTGYLYILGIKDDGILDIFLLQTLAIIFLFYNTMVMERQKYMWGLLSATAKGKVKIIRDKVVICSLFTIILALLTVIIRIIKIAQSYTLKNPGASVKSIPEYSKMPIGIPVAGWIALMILVQTVVLLIIMAVVLFVSGKMKTPMQVLFILVLILVVPLILMEMKIGVAGRFSLYGIYSILKG